MSICAQLYVLFRVKPTAERVKEIESGIVSLLGYKPWTMNRHGRDDEAFLVPRDTDSLDFTQQGRITTRMYDRSLYGELPGPVSSERFYEISYLSRWWSDFYPDGPMQEYGKTMIFLMSQADIEYVWFTSDEFDSIDPMTSTEVESMMKQAAEIAENNNDSEEQS